MTALQADRKAPRMDDELIDLPVGTAKKIYAGSIVAVDQATGYAEAGSDAAAKLFAGIAITGGADNTLGQAGDLDIEVATEGLFLLNIAAATQADVGSPVFIHDDQTVALAAGSVNKIYCGTIGKLESATQVWVNIEAAIQQTDVATHIADATGAHAASAISIADGGGFTAHADVETALQEIYQHIESIQKIIPIPLTSFVDVAGTQLTTFADAEGAQPGLELTNSKALGIRWNDHAAPLAVMSQFVVPNDANVAANMTLKALASKIGATAGDATKFTVALYNQVAATLHDADANYGGNSSAMTGNAASKTVQQVTLTLALANLPAAGSNVTLTIKPKDGTLTDDDVCLHAVWIEYKGKALTS